MRVLNRIVVIVTPQQPFLDWLRRVDTTSRDFQLDAVQRDANAYLLPDRDSEEHTMADLKSACTVIFEEELGSWLTDTDAWPVDRTFTTFESWFSFSIHTMAIDLTKHKLKVEEL
jgi:hypothetical protein